jgi:hypothetical protein
MPSAVPATPAQIADPSVDREALSAEELSAVARRRLTSSEWVMVATFFVTALFMMGAVRAASSPAAGLERERQAVREAVFQAQLDEVMPRVVASDGVLCLALFGSIDPPAELVLRFADAGVPVLPVSDCRRGLGPAAQRDGWLLSVGAIRWGSFGRVHVMAGTDRVVQYTLEPDGRRFRVKDARTL